MAGPVMTAHGVIGLLPEKCTSCMICVEECPTWCITLDHHVEEVSEPGARRLKKVNVLDAFHIDYGLCMYCGICVDLCPFDALEWRSNVDYAATDRAGLVQGVPELQAWITGS
jgi:NADH-quinone oxidoreductase subunit I